MKQDVNEVGMPISQIYNKNCRSNPKYILQNLNPCSCFRKFRRLRPNSRRTSIILKIITT
ncbi:hypothetical protein HanPI659440_Chr09g0318411 [Helianthus annuus]|nr:hypothetical protein HanPI659440_Chr09g0318411 [Helianthus annuus]